MILARRCQPFFDRREPCIKKSKQSQSYKQDHNCREVQQPLGKVLGAESAALGGVSGKDVCSRDIDLRQFEDSREGKRTPPLRHEPNTKLQADDRADGQYRRRTSSDDEHPGERHEPVWDHYDLSTMVRTMLQILPMYHILAIHCGVRSQRSIKNDLHFRHTHNSAMALAHITGGCGFSWVRGMQPVSVLSPADRVRRAFMRLGVLIAVIAFVVVGSDVLLAQWISGSASAEFMLGTAALIAGICIGLFAIIAAIGLVVALVLTTKR